MAKGTGNRREQMKLETRRIILDAAYKLFEENGYEKATMRELAAKAEVGIGTIFQHFNDKASLVVAAFEEDIEAVLREAMRTIPSENIKRQLLHIAGHMFEFYAARPQLSKALLKEVLFLEGEQAKGIDEQHKRMYPYLAGLITQSIERGELRNDINVFVTVAAISSFYIMTLIKELWQDGFNIEDGVATLGSLLDQHFKGFLDETENSDS